MICLKWSEFPYAKGSPERRSLRFPGNSLRAEMTYPEYFRQLTGYSPYGFQEALGQCLLKRESLVFRAPTGSGKTWATVAPFLYSIRECKRLADRLIYALPLRSLASSLHTTVLSSLRRIEPVESNAKNRDYPSTKLYCSLQMGGEKNDPFFEGDLIFCTIDQVLSGYLMMPLSLPDRLANIVAGALPGSLLILDEAHLLESRVALGTVIEMLDRFRGLIQFVLMTATMSDESMHWISRKLGAGVPDLPEAEIRQLPVQVTKRRIWRWRGGQLSSNDVVNGHHGGRTLVIVNRVERAQDLFLQLKKFYRGAPTRVACLHSRFFPEDRRRIEGDLQSWFGRDASQSDVILVTTQVVEAGMDISADQILTELSPMNSLVQRAGRTARYVERCSGAVTVFEVETNLPYNDYEQELTRTRECLQEVPEEGEDVDFLREQRWVEHVHKSAEKRALSRYESLHGRRELVENAIRTGDRGRLGDLVRDIDSVNILLADRPEQVQFDDRRWPALLSVPRTAIWKLGPAVQSGAEGIWKAESPDDESGPLRFTWSRIRQSAELSGVWLIALGSAAASYTQRAGLRIGQPGEPKPVIYVDLPPVLRYQYVYESWADHVTRVMEQARAMAFANSIGARELANVLSLAVETTEKLMELTVMLHDVGKLSAKWQSEAWNYETARTGRQRTEAIAHTTKKIGERGPALPPHAVEGAFAATPMLARDYSNAGWSVASAVARHHSARAKTCCEFELIPEAEKLLHLVGGGAWELRDGRSGLDLKEFAQDLEATWEEAEWWPAYAYLVRRLRLADQAGTAAGVRDATGAA